jgi:hypothetical protein
MHANPNFSGARSKSGLYSIKPVSVIGEVNLGTLVFHEMNPPRRESPSLSQRSVSRFLNGQQTRGEYQRQSKSRKTMPFVDCLANQDRT